MLQRVNLKIQSRLQPDQTWGGYLVLTERGKETMSFFSERKIPAGDQVTMTVMGLKPFRLKALVSSCHDRTASGRVMREEPPDSERPYVIRTMYRCNALHELLEPIAVPTSPEVQEETPAPEAVTETPEVTPAAAA